MVICMARKPRKKKVVEPDMGTDIPIPVGFPDNEPMVTVAPTLEPTKQEQIDTLLKNHPDFLGTMTQRYYGETLYPWLHELEQLIG